MGRSHASYGYERGSAFAAEEEDGLFAEQIPEPPRRVQPQSFAPGIERNSLLHLYANLVTQIAKVLDGAEVDVWCFVPIGRQIIGARHMPAEHDLPADA